MPCVKMTKRIKILDCPIDSLTREATLSRICDAIANGEQLQHVVVNAGKLVLMQRDPQLRQSVVQSHLISADGMAVVWASRILRQPLPERVTGIDLMNDIIRTASRKRYSIYFLGATEDVVSKVVDQYAQEFGWEIVAGYRNGYFDKDEEQEVAKKIADSGANILLVAMSSPKKENFLNHYRGLMTSVNFVMGVGGSFDVAAGLVQRAPTWMQAAGIEWCYRLVQEPRRMWKRYLIGNPHFILLVMREWIKLHFGKLAL